MTMGKTISYQRRKKNGQKFKFSFKSRTNKM